MELSSEVPGTAADWPPDITLSVNGIEIGTSMSPGVFGDKRGVYTPAWWKLNGSQYGMLKSWSVRPDGTYVDLYQAPDKRTQGGHLQTRSNFLPLVVYEISTIFRKHFNHTNPQQATALNM